MRKVLPIIVIIVILVSFVLYYVNQWEDSSLKDSHFVTEQRYLEISQSPSELANFVNEVKQNPSQVITIFTTIRKMIHSVDLNGKDVYNKDERESLILMQRNLFHEELLSQTPKATQILNVEGERAKWQEIEFNIIGSDSLQPKFYPPSIVNDELDFEIKEVAIIQTVYYTNDLETEGYKDTDIYTEYIIVRNMNNMWEILGWQRIDKFEIVK